MKFIDSTVGLTVAIAGSYDWALVALSNFVAILFATMALYVKNLTNHPLRGMWR